MRRRPVERPDAKDRGADAALTFRPPCSILNRSRGRGLSCSTELRGFEGLAVYAFWILATDRVLSAVM